MRPEPPAVRRARGEFMSALLRLAPQATDELATIVANNQAALASLPTTPSRVFVSKAQHGLWAPFDEWSARWHVDERWVRWRVRRTAVRWAKDEKALTDRIMRRPVKTAPSPIRKADRRVVVHVADPWETSSTTKARKRFSKAAARLFKEEWRGHRDALKSKGFIPPCSWKTLARYIEWLVANRVLKEPKISIARRVFPKSAEGHGRQSVYAGIKIASEFIDLPKGRRTDRRAD